MEATTESAANFRLWMSPCHQLPQEPSRLGYRELRNGLPAVEGSSFRGWINRKRLTTCRSSEREARQAAAWGVREGGSSETPGPGAERRTSRAPWCPDIQWRSAEEEVEEGGREGGGGGGGEAHAWSVQGEWDSREARLLLRVRGGRHVWEGKGGRDDVRREVGGGVSLGGAGGCERDEGMSAGGGRKL
uniref:Uncharacterized protein n=1 Tax=Knipowitschia caucasica TaxID=637954 RepID=A0AAV2JN53_KNICA